MLSLGHTLQNKFLGMVGRFRYHAFDRHYTHTIRIGIVLTTLLLTALVAIIINSSGLIGLVVVGAMAALVVLVLVSNFMAYAVFSLIIVSTVINPPLPRDLTVTLLLLLLLLFVWLVRLVIADRSFKSIQPSLPNRFIVLFGIAVVISYLWSTFYVDPFVRYLQEDKYLPRLLTGIVLVTLPVSAILFGYYFRSVGSMQRLVWYFVAYGGVISIVSAVGVGLPRNFNVGGQLGVWTSLFAFGQVLFNRNLKSWQRLVLLGIIGAWVFVSVFRGATWLSGWVPLIGGLGLLFAMRFRVGVLLLIVASLVLVAARWDRVMEMVFIEQAESGNSRVEAANSTLAIANDHFLFGTGPTGYYFYMTATATTFFQLSHNNYLDIYAQTGIVGFAIWILLWLSIGWVCWRAYRSSPAEGFVKGLSSSILAMYPVIMMLMLLGDWVIPFTYTGTMAAVSYAIWPWMWVGLAMSLVHINVAKRPTVQ